MGRRPAFLAALVTVLACGGDAREPAATTVLPTTDAPTSANTGNDDDDDDDDDGIEPTSSESGADDPPDDTGDEATTEDPGTTGEVVYDGPTGTFDIPEVQARVFVPDTVHTLGHPVSVIYGFHGAGDDEANFLGVWMGGGSWGQIATDEGIILVAFRGTASAQSIWEYPDAINGWPLDVGNGDLERVTGLHDWLLTQYDVDDARVYAIGFSMGATMATEVALALDDRFAAFMATSQGTPVSDYAALAPTSGYVMPGLFHGDPQDPVYASIPYTVDLLQANGHEIEVREQPGAGHVGAWMESTIYDPGPAQVWGWLSSHTR